MPQKSPDAEAAKPNPAPHSRRPQIVVADGHTLNPGDLDWSPLSRLGELRVHERCGQALISRCEHADIVLTNKEVLGAEVLNKLPNLKLISILATGTNVVDVQAANAQGVVVCNVPAYSTDSVAEHVFALIFELNNQVSRHARAVSDGAWSASGHFSYRLGPIHELSSKTLGVVGMGNIGKRVATIGAALGMRVVAAKQRSMSHVSLPCDLRWLDLDELAATSDVISLHCPLNRQTKGLVSAAFLKRLNPNALLINTGRGQLVDEAALEKALASGRLRGAGLDVLQAEPPQAAHPLLALANCIVTPHLAWATVEARSRLLRASIENVRAFLAGTPQNVV